MISLRNSRLNVEWVGEKRKNARGEKNNKELFIIFSAARVLALRAHSTLKRLLCRLAYESLHFPPFSNLPMARESKVKTDE